MDSQAERAIGIIKNIISMYLGSKDTYWLEALLILEFLHNAIPHMIMGQSPHMLAYGTDLRGLDTLCQKMMLEHLPDMLQEACTALEKAQKAQAIAYTRRRRDVKYTIREQVLLQRDAIAKDPKIAAKYRTCILGPI